MYNAESIEQEKTEEDITVEISDLDQPPATGSRLFLRIAPAVLEWQRVPKRRHWRWISSVCIVLLLVIVLSMSNGLSFFRVISFKATHTGAAVPSPRLPQRDGITCLTDAAWSPDSSSIAVLGYQHNCYRDDASVLVNLYDAHSSKLMAQLHPDAAIVRALGNSLSFPLRQPFAIDYVHIIWSPDGQRLALTFDTVSEQPSVNGVELVNRDGGHAQVLLQQQYPTAPFYAEWDLARSRPVPFTPPLSAFSLMPLPPALAYRWGTNGTLVPETLLTPTTVPAVPALGPVGNPDGDPSFTIWQPGSAHVASFADSSRLYTWSTDFAAWSPDGRYLVDGIALFGLLKPPEWLFPSSETLVISRMNQAPQLPIHDRAFLKVIDSARVLAWNPNGHVLAAYSSGKSVDLYNCISGDRFASFVLQSKDAASPTDAPLLRWSPDGLHLLISSVLWGLLTLRGPNQLPK
jgi:hypothetical protein